MDTFETIAQDKRLMYEYIRGSHLYGLNNEDSDVDTSGLFIAPRNVLLGLDSYYQNQVSDERHDTTWFELGDFCALTLKSNPTVLEALFVPENKVITPPSEIVMPLFENKEKFEKIWEMLKDVPKEQWTAHFVCAIAVIRPDGSHFVVQEQCDGVLLDSPRGENGFGYDPIFYVPEIGKTTAEISDEEKNAISHRGKALRSMLAILKE